MIQNQFVLPSGAFTHSVPVRFSLCDPAARRASGVDVGARLGAPLPLYPREHGSKA